MILFFFGPPGAGKGTQATLISKYLGIPHLSSGDILRKKLLDKDPLSLKLRKIMDSGNLLSDDMINEIMEYRLNLGDCEKGFILDGYPRTKSQNKFITNYFEKNKLYLSLIFQLTVDKNTVVNRIKARSNIEKRKDDKEDIIKTRISQYIEETKPVFNYYNTKYHKKYYVINGNQEIQKIYEDIVEILKKS